MAGSGTSGWQRRVLRITTACGVAAFLVVALMSAAALGGPIPANPDCNPANSTATGLNVIMGTSGDDTLVGTGAADAIYGLAGNDQLAGFDGDDILCGGAGDDLLLGGDGADAIEGESGNDTADGGDGKDYVSGGDGNDTLSGGAERDKVLGEDGDDVLIGNAGNDLMFGGADADELRGSAGNDFLHGGSGNDFIRGQDGNDTVLAGGGDDLVWGGNDDDTLFGMRGNDILLGNLGDDRGFGGGGNDTINGNGGVDFANGGSGIDDCDAETEINCNLPPDAVDDSVANPTGDYDTDEDTGFTAGNVLDNDTDPNGDPLAVTGVDTTGTLGAVVDNSDGTFGYTPPASFNALAVGESATDSWNYTAADPGGLTDTATVTVTVFGVNDPPTANPDPYAVDNDATLVVNGVLDNDTDPDTSDMLIVSQVQGSAGNVGAATATTQGGTVTVAADGSFTYDPTTSATLQALAAGATLDDTFTYQASDGNGGTGTATATISVTGVPGTIVVEKQTLPDGDAQMFTFTGDAAGTIGDGGTITVAGLSPGVYSSTETVPVGWDLTSIVCDDANSTGNVGTATATFNVEPGETVTCVFTNTKDGEIVVEKQTLPDGDPATFTFTGDAAGTIGDGGTITVGVAPGAYSSTETVPAGWALTDISCDDANSTGNVGTATATFNVEPGETVTCVFTNTKVNLPPVVTPSGGAAAFTEGGGAVTVDGGITVTDGDNPLLDKATVTITNLLDPTFETLAATASGGIAAGDITYSAPTLTIDPAVDQPLADFQAVLQSVTYDNADQDPNAAPRVVRFVANDGTADSNNGDVTVTVTAVNDAPSLTVPSAYSSTGNVGIDVPAGSGLVTAATITDPDFAGPFTVGGTVPATTTGGGALSIAADGSFTYDPLAGFTGADTFDYQVCDAGSPLPSECSAAQTVTINVGDLIWFIDNSAAGGNDGTLANPFQSIGDFNGSAGPGAGDGIYLAETGTDYTTGIVLQNDQRLIGEGTPGDPATAFGITLPTNSYPLPGINGTAPMITTTNATGIVLAGGNTIRGLDVGNTGTGAAFKDGGATVGTLTISDVTVSGTGSGIDIVNGGTLAVTFDSLTSTSSSTGINLDGVGGSFTVSNPGAGTDTSISNAGVGIDISNAAGAATFDFGETSVSGSAGIDLSTNALATFTFDSLNVTSSGDGLTASTSGTINIGGTTSTISATGGAALDLSGVTVGNGSGGAATLQTVQSTASPTDGINLTSVSGSLTVTGTTTAGAPTGDGIDITSSPGTFTFSGVDIDTTTGTGFKAVGGGTVNVTGTANTIDTTTGVGVNISGTTIGASGVTFRSINVNGATNGIVLDGTGTSGGFSVTGDGTTTRNTSGGVIQNTTGAGVLLTDTQNVVLNHVRLLATGSHGIRGTGVTNLTFSHGDMLNVGGGTDVELLHFNDATSGRNDNLLGTLTIRNSAFTDWGTAGSQDGIRIDNLTGSLTVDIDDSVFSKGSAATYPTNTDAIHLRPEGGNASITLQLDGTTFTRAGGVEVVTQGASTRARVEARDNTFTDFADRPFTITGNAGGDINVQIVGNVTGNVFNNANPVGAQIPDTIHINAMGDTDADVSIIGNDFNRSGGDVIAMTQDPNSAAFTPVMRVRIHGNTFDGFDDDMIPAFSENGSGTMHITITNNTVNASGITALQDNIVRLFTNNNNNVVPAPSPMIIALIDGNTVNDARDGVVSMRARGNNGATDSIHATVTNNGITAAAGGEWLETDIDGTGSTICVNSSGNQDAAMTSAAPTAAALFDNTGVGDLQLVQASIAAWQAANNGAGAPTVVGSGVTTFGATCTGPPTLPTH